MTQQIEAHLAAFGQKCEIGKSHFEAALLLRDHEQLEAGALRTYATARSALFLCHFCGELIKSNYHLPELFFGMK